MVVGGGAAAVAVVPSSAVIIAAIATFTSAVGSTLFVAFFVAVIVTTVASAIGRVVTVCDPFESTVNSGAIPTRWTRSERDLPLVPLCLFRRLIFVPRLWNSSFSFRKRSVVSCLERFSRASDWLSSMGRNNEGTNNFDIAVVVAVTARLWIRH